MQIQRVVLGLDADVAQQGQVVRAWRLVGFFGGLDILQHFGLGGGEVVLEEVGAYQLRTHGGRIAAFSDVAVVPGDGLVEVLAGEVDVGRGVDEVQLVLRRHAARLDHRFQRRQQQGVVAAGRAELHAALVQDVGFVRGQVRQGRDLVQAVFQFGVVLGRQQFFGLGRVDQLVHLWTHGVLRCFRCRRGFFCSVGGRYANHGRRDVQAEGGQDQANLSETNLGHDLSFDQRHKRYKPRIVT